MEITNEEEGVLYFIGYDASMCGTDEFERKFFFDGDEASAYAHSQAVEHYENYEHNDTGCTNEDDEDDDDCDNDCENCGFNVEPEYNSWAEVYDPEKHDKHFNEEWFETEEAGDEYFYSKEIAKVKELFDVDMKATFFGNEKELNTYTYGYDNTPYNDLKKCRAMNFNHAVVLFILNSVNYFKLTDHMVIEDEFKNLDFKLLGYKEKFFNTYDFEYYVKVVDKKERMDYIKLLNAKLENKLKTNNSNMWYLNSPRTVV